MASGTQQIKLLEWIPRTKPCSLPKGAVAGGFTLEGEETYVARCGNTCGAYIPSKGVASVPYKGVEEFRKSFDILVCHDPEIIFWSNSNSREDVPNFSVAIDDEEVVENEFWHYLLDWKQVYITRRRPNTPLTGLKTVSEDRKVKINVYFKHPMLGKYMNDCMHLAYKGKECYLNEYQVLCAYRPPTIQRTIPRPYTWVPASKEHVPENSFVGGKTTDGNNIYIARVYQPSTRKPGTKSVSPGYIIPSMKLCYRFKEYSPPESTSYKILIPLYSSNDLQWSCSEINKYSRIVDVDSIHYICRPISGHGIGYCSPHFRNQKDYLVKHVSHSFHNYESDSYQTDNTDDQVETLVVLPIPNTLRELCRYAILQSTYGVPHRINELPLPKHMKKFCQLRKKLFCRNLS